MLSETLQRPKPGETEEDVLALQEEFLRSRYLPSATLVKANDENLRYKAHFKVQQESKRSTKREGAFLDSLTTCYTRGQNVCCIVARDVQEKDIGVITKDLPSLTRFAKDGFPSAPVVQKETLLVPNENTSCSKKSIFALMLEKTAPETFGVKESSLLQQMNADTAPIDSVGSNVSPLQCISQQLQESDYLQASSLLTGDGLVCSGVSRPQAAHEVQKIHSENLHLLSSLTQKEILEEQTRIKELLGSKISVFKRKSTTCEQDKEPT